MSSTYSSLLRIELIGTGDQPGTWGDTTNTNLGTLIEQAIAATATVSVTATNVTLSELNGSSDQSRCAALLITGSPGTTRNVVAPALSKMYVVSNTSDSSIVLKTSTSTGLTIPSGVTQFTFYNGTDFIAVSQPYDADLKALADLATTGIIVRTGSGTAATRSIAVSGTGLSISNADGVSGNPTIASNATSANTASTIVARDASGNFSGGTITAATQFSGAGTGLTGTASGLSIGGTAATATAPASGGSFITSSNIGSQSVSYATNAGTATTAGTLSGNWVYMPSGTVVTFAQASAPTGWTQITTDLATNRMLRVVNSTGGGSGGTASPILMDVVPSHTHTYSGTSAGQSQSHTHTVSGTSGAMSANASHTHGITDPGHSHNVVGGGGGGSAATLLDSAQRNYATSSATTGISVNSANIDHTHTFSATSATASVDHTHTYSGTTATNGSSSNWAPRYVDIILCSKD